MKLVSPRTVALLSALALGAILLTGCQSGEMSGALELKVGQDGGLEAELTVPGSLDVGTQGGLESEGWRVSAGSESWKASRSFGDLAEFDEHDDDIADALLSAFEYENGYRPEVVEPMKLTVSATDFFFAERRSATLSLPKIETAPTVCVDCGGDGGEDCYDCGGDGNIECASCGGDGLYEGYWGPERCYSCEGYGSTDCYACEGDGVVECTTCYGSGEPQDYQIEAAAEAAKAASFDVEVSMPGSFVSADGGDPAWKLDGDEAIGGDELTASSWVIDWLNSGIALGVLGVVVGTGGFFGVRKLARSASAASEARRARAAAAAQAQQDAWAQQSAWALAQAAESPPTDARYCSQCGAPSAAEAAFCKQCGVPLGVPGPPLPDQSGASPEWTPPTDEAR